MSKLQAGQPELIAVEKTLKENMISAGTAREVIVDIHFITPVSLFLRKSRVLLS